MGMNLLSGVKKLYNKYDRKEALFAAFAVSLSLMMLILLMGKVYWLFVTLTSFAVCLIWFEMSKPNFRISGYRKVAITAMLVVSFIMIHVVLWT